jgi:hypothetical protein
MHDSLRDVHEQLEALRQQREQQNPELYRDLALYLQVLRDGLLSSIQQACFHLATEVHPDRYQALEAERRRHLHRRLRTLVSRVCSLLTVEQLAQLAGQQAQAHLLERRRRQQQWLEGMQAGLATAAAGASDDPPGSVQLGLRPPLDLLPGDSPLMGAQADTAAVEPCADSDSSVEAPMSAGPEELLGALHTVVEHLESEGEEEGTPGPLPPWDQGQLPRDPGALLVWLDGFELALVRRLRNLSHAINVELLRAGLSRSLLPLSLLEAASQGELELQQAPANLIRLPLTGLEVVALLLRPADLEQHMPALRTCRSRWRQQRQEVRRMAELSRGLLRRVQVLEAEQLWLQDIASPPS